MTQSGLTCFLWPNVQTSVKNVQWAKPVSQDWKCVWVSNAFTCDLQLIWRNWEVPVISTCLIKTVSADTSNNRMWWFITVFNQIFPSKIGIKRLSARAAVLYPLIFWYFSLEANFRNSSLLACFTNNIISQKRDRKTV